ncbi:uncharacterized mitochondrial protein AtMg01250-like [Cicer arietinum]|uniref:uncharacterized mitochondrial protein AtMg01250-like n=1 Tax=Cicer arietinum TaxID=3827 RepID=UPI003CC63E15
MAKMSFPEKWRKWILKCVGSASVYVLVNGSPTEEYVMWRRMRQGDLLSPFLFLLDVEDLNALCSAYVKANRFKDFEMGSNEFRVSVLQFVDETLIMGEK